MILRVGRIRNDLKKITELCGIRAAVGRNTQPAILSKRPFSAKCRRRRYSQALEMTAPISELIRILILINCPTGRPSLEQGRIAIEILFVDDLPGPVPH